nr:phospholipase D beta 1-like [Tanacetum cinerariifolium]
IRVRLRRPMGLESCATWDRDNITWEGRDEGVGTVQALSIASRRFMIHVNSKGMITDDEFVMLGSANINQCLLEGHGFIGYPFGYRVTLGFGSIAGGLDHVNPVIRLPLEHGISRVLGKDDHSNPNSIDNIMDGINIDDLTIEQYLRLTPEHRTPSMVKKDMELDKEAGYTTDEESVMSKHKAIDPIHSVNTQSFEEELSLEEDLDEEECRVVHKNKQIRVVEADLKNSSEAMEDTINNDGLTNASNNVMPRSIYEYLKLANLEGATMSVKMDDMTQQETLRTMKNFLDTRNYDTVDPQNEIARQTNPLLDKGGFTKKWHVCKPVQVFYDGESGEDCGMWPTCDPDSSFCYGYKEVFRNCDREWLDNGTPSTTTVFDKCTYKTNYPTPISPDEWDTRYDEYKRVFDNEVENLSNDYPLRIGKKGYVLDDV